MLNESNSQPIVLHRADPWVVKHTDGYYYFTATVPEYDSIEIRRSKTIKGLADAEQKRVWHQHEEGAMSSYIWAPELHFVDGSWYVYFAADNKTYAEKDIFDHRMYVLKNSNANPLEGEWEEKGQIKTDWESFSLDATSFVHNSTQYLVWAQMDKNIPGNSNLYIAEMENPWTLGSKQTMITKPEYDWEIIGYLVNEGAAVVEKGGKIFVSYSASATDRNYCMGLLWADEDADLLDAKSWSKSDKPVFTTNEEWDIYGPGHNSFTVSEDGKHDVLIYHARKSDKIDGNPLDDPNRMTFMKQFVWDEKGMPDFNK